MSDPFAPVNSDRRTRRVGGVELEIVIPVPAGITPAPTSHPKLGKPTQIWTYHDAAGGVLGYIHRYEGKDGKQFRPVTLWRPTGGGKPEWRWESWPAPRPLYGLDRLTERPSALVVVTEGEKTAAACQRLLPGVVAVSAPNGAKSAHKADWTTLNGRQITIWPDADAAGLEYARAVAKLISQAGAVAVMIVAPPSRVKVGWDAADALEEGWDEARATELIGAAKAFNAETAPRGRKQRHRDDLIGVVVSTEGVELWHDAGGEGYATVPVNGHLENWRLRSDRFERWLSHVWYRKTGIALPTQTLEEVKRTLDVKAYTEGPEHQPFVRVGERNGTLYLDLCDERWRAVEIGSNGWAVIDRPPVKFLRAASARPLPEPEHGNMIELLRRFVNVVNEDEFRLIVAWLVAALRPGFPFPILIVNGTQGSGKSVLCRLLRSLIDPDLAPICAAPKDERDLFLAASNTWLCAYDNLSEVSGFLPDALCRVASGGALRTRALHTNRDETVIAVQRPMMLNGIPSLIEQADVGRRAIVINLVSITADQRQAEADFWQDFERVRPQIVGALLDAASRAVREIAAIRLDHPGSMADFEKWSMAAASALGWTAKEFQTAYRNNENAVAEDTFEADPFAIAVIDFITRKHPDGWEGQPAALQIELDEVTPERIRKSRSWPKSPAQLGNRIKRAIPVLEHKGFAVDRRKSGTRTITIVPPKSVATNPS